MNRPFTQISRRFANREICDVCSAVIMTGQHIVERIARDLRTVRIHAACFHLYEAAAVPSCGPSH
jgi:hypothetical protein